MLDTHLSEWREFHRQLQVAQITLERATGSNRAAVRLALAAEIVGLRARCDAALERAEATLSDMDNA